MVDPVRVLRLLRALTSELSVLNAARADVKTSRDDPMWLRGVKYSFVTAIEACVDVAQHICASEGWGPPSDNGAAVELLGEHGAVDRELARQVRRAVGFRNILVHRYADVDDELVLEHLDQIGVLRAFAGAVGRYVEDSKDTHA